MRSLFTFFSVILIAVFTTPVFSQHSQHHPGKGKMMTDTTAMTPMMSGNRMQGGMMQGGMMGNMMQGMHGGGMGMMNQCPMCGMMMGGHGMMQGGMMGNMMQGMHGGMGMMGVHNSMRKEMMLINKLPDMQDYLTLTEEQIQKLNQIRNDFQKKQIDRRASLAKKQIDMQTMFDNDASSSDIRKVMEEIANIKIDMAIAAYETAGRMKDVLSSDQKNKLKSNKYKNMMGGSMMW